MRPSPSPPFALRGSSFVADPAPTPSTSPGSSFHFCRFFPGEGFTAALARHEYSLASKIGLKAGMRVLDVGCGIGGPARNIARFSDANIVGINNNDFQVARAQKYTAEAGLANQVTFEKVRSPRRLDPF